MFERGNNRTMVTLRKDRLSLAMAGLSGCEDVRDLSPRGMIEWIASR